MNRRHFLHVLLATGAYPLINQSAFSQSLSIRVIGGGQFKYSAEGELQSVISVLDLSKQQPVTTKTTFLPHGIHRNPNNPDVFAVFEKKGSGACEFNIKQNKVVRAIKTQPERYFYGHGAYSNDGKLLFATETDLNSMNGVIAIRDASTLEYLGEFPSFGKEPHECQLINQGKTLMVTNAGGEVGGDSPCVTMIDVVSRKLLKKVQLSNSQINTGHAGISKQGELVVVSAPRVGSADGRLGGVSIGEVSAEGERILIEHIDKPEKVVKRMHGEALSIAIHGDIAGVTHPEGDMITFWSLKRKTLIKAIHVPYPRGIAFISDKKQFLISYGREANVVLIDSEGLRVRKASVINKTFITGSHLFLL